VTSTRGQTKVAFRVKFSATLGTEYGVVISHSATARFISLPMTPARAMLNSKLVFISAVHNLALGSRDLEVGLYEVEEKPNLAPLERSNQNEAWTGRR
jgi:hypothetical protein